MQNRDHAKAVALLVGVAVLLVSLVHMAGCRIASVCPAGIGPDATLVSRLLHPLVHVGLLHAVVNVYVLWQVVFFCDIRCRHLLGAFVVACCCPSWVAAWPYCWIQRWRCCALLLLWQVPGLCAGGVAVGMHLYCFVAGVALVRASRVIGSR